MLIINYDHFTVQPTAHIKNAFPSFHLLSSVYYCNVKIMGMISSKQLKYWRSLNSIFMA